MSFITIYFWFPFYFPLLSFLVSFSFIRFPVILSSAQAHCSLSHSSVYIYCTVISAELLVRMSPDIDLCLVTAGCEAVAEQLHMCVSWCYLLSLFLTERGHQTLGGPDVMSEH